MPHTTLTSNTSGKTGLVLVLVRQFNDCLDPGPKFQLLWDGEVTASQYTLLVDEVNLIGIIILDMARVGGIVKKCGAGVIFQVDSNQILYVRECYDLETIMSSYEQLKKNEYANNQIHFVDNSGIFKLVNYTSWLWARRLGFILPY